MLHIIGARLSNSKDIILQEITMWVVTYQTIQSRDFIFQTYIFFIVRPFGRMPKTAMWIICSASPSAALKIKGNNQQITQHFTHPLFSFMCRRACKALFFFPEILHLLRRGSRRKGAPPQPNSAHPEVKGKERADWLWTPVPSRHTTGWGRWHPPGNHLLPAVLHCSSPYIYFFLIPLFKAGSHFSDRKQRWGGEGIHSGQTYPSQIRVTLWFKLKKINKFHF